MGYRFMFLNPDARPEPGLRPAASQIDPNDWEILSQSWYPLVELTELEDGPAAARLLDVDLVVYRGDAGVTVALDRCPHRHIKLSAGKVRDGNIICPYHALAFDGNGRCTHIPAIGAGARIPDSYALHTFPVTVKYGLVWTTLAEEKESELPEFPDIPSDGTGICFIKTRTWPVSAARQIENFFDIGHLPIVHSATLGNDETMPVQPGKVIQNPEGVTLHAHYVERPFGGAERKCEYRYRVILPFSLELKIDDETGHSMVVYDVVSPISAYECRVFQFLKDTRHINENHRQLIEGLDAVNVEDIGILENLAMINLPLNQHHEIHLQVDNISHAYRARLAQLGLGRGGPGSRAPLRTVSAA